MIICALRRCVVRNPIQRWCHDNWPLATGTVETRNQIRTGPMLQIALFEVLNPRKYNLIDHSLLVAIYIAISCCRLLDGRIQMRTGCASVHCQSENNSFPKTIAAKSHH